MGTRCNRFSKNANRLKPCILDQRWSVALDWQAVQQPYIYLHGTTTYLRYFHGWFSEITSSTLRGIEWNSFSCFGRKAIIKISIPLIQEQITPAIALPPGVNKHISWILLL